MLAGGSSRRFGSDKLAALLDGRPVLDHCLSGMPVSWPLVLVSPPRMVPSEVEGRVRFVRESPPGGGPLAGIAAGLALVTTDVVCVAPGDSPRAGEVLPTLVAALEGDPTVSAAVLSDGEARANPVLAAYRTKDLREAIPDAPENLPARTLLTLPHVLVQPDFDVPDIDTPEDLQR
ncbi:molybdopterin-guanine dinucleotide biosynthesis protein [Knoellia sinensis KCTC 19936]|uniref:Molybdopterin-guanine dinucleotide biosynthesis protein n=1 Tax=Knoellia sinensis KCTC 19936 TaxID=1385520 RepID=A0A0A0JBF7_9MICO|nr:molybdopterin-guanine dinucleotide biosynthesis protein [Knoellia sinensis KCTC 19936]